jgi:hypothetical protein
MWRRHADFLQLPGRRAWLGGPQTAAEADKGNEHFGDRARADATAGAFDPVNGDRVQACAMAQQVAEEFDIKAEPLFLEVGLHGAPSGGGHDFASALSVRHGQAKEQANDHPEPEAGDEAHWGALNVVFVPADADGDGGGASLRGVEGEGRDAGGFGGRDGAVGIDESN